jgi:hypothetical protein
MTCIPRQPVKCLFSTSLDLFLVSACVTTDKEPHRLHIGGEPTGGVKASGRAGVGPPSLHLCRPSVAVLLAGAFVVHYRLKFSC